MTNTPTPGPWLVRLHAGTSVNGAAIVSASTGALVVALPRVADRPYYQKEADAYLIAASPVLLAACQMNDEKIARLIQQWRERAETMKANDHKFPDRFTYERCADELEAVLKDSPRPVVRRSEEG